MSGRQKVDRRMPDEGSQVVSCNVDSTVVIVCIHSQGSVDIAHRSGQWRLINAKFI